MRLTRLLGYLLAAVLLAALAVFFLVWEIRLDG
jgi:hypothetical protein